MAGEYTQRVQAVGFDQQDLLSPACGEQGALGGVGEASQVPGWWQQHGLDPIASEDRGGGQFGRGGGGGVEHGAQQCGAMPAATRELCVGQVRPEQPGAGEVGVCEISAGEVGIGQPGAGEVGVCEISAGEVGVGQPDAA